MKVVKWIGIGLGGVAILVGVIVGVVFWLTGGAADATNEFLALVGQGRYEDALRTTSPQFQAQQDPARFRATMQRFGIDKFKSASWSSREINNDRTILRGTIETRDGNRIPAVAVLVEVGGKWRLYSMEFSPAGLRAGTAPPIPDAAAVKALVQRSLLDFNDAVKRRDFTAFHATMSEQLRGQYTAAALQTTFKSFIDQNIDIAGIRGVEPTFTHGPVLFEGWRLDMIGYYPTAPSRVHFNLAFRQEGGAWRAVGFNVSVRPAK